MKEGFNSLEGSQEIIDDVLLSIKIHKDNNSIYTEKQSYSNLRVKENKTNEERKMHKEKKFLEIRKSSSVKGSKNDLKSQKTD